VFDGVDGDTVAAQRRRVVQASEVGEGSGDLDPDVRPPEADSVFGRRRLQRETDGPAGVEADPGASDRALERSSIGHVAASALTQVLLGRADGCNVGATTSVGLSR
jgi:hypothetical protein